MKNAGAVLPSSSSAMAASSSLAAASSFDRSRKATRRDKARKSSVYAGAAAGGDASSNWEERQYRVAIHMEILEGVFEHSATVDDNDDEYDEFEELDRDDLADDPAENSSKTHSKKKKRKRISGHSPSSSNLTLPTYLRPRSLASILIEEASRSDSVAKRYVGAAVKRFDPGSKTGTKPYPMRKFCPVTGLLGVYTDPKSGIPYASLSALEQIRERAPPWMNAANGGTASYWEAMNTLKSDL